MDRELLKELNEERMELEVPREIYVPLVSLAIEYKNNTGISDQEVAEIIRTAISNFDYAGIEEEYTEGVKTARQTFNSALESLGYGSIRK